MAFTRKVYYTSEFRFWGVFLVCELWYYYNVMIFQKVKREIWDLIRERFNNVLYYTVQESHI
ncbi:hypothetical protein DWY02_07910 [Eubacterium sp. AF22-9]|nr:hypothetical protein DWY02_07910 [Eubacterium sp. AF22-9]